MKRPKLTTAEAVTEMTQELRDGNRIEQRSMTTIARDGRGRVRREQALPLLGPVMLDSDVRIIRMSTTSCPQQRYDHRLRDLVQRTGDLTIATEPPGSRAGAPRIARCEQNV